jgi:uncharacterized membrane protein AbrB (regulator of aidB expression)
MAEKLNLIVYEVIGAPIPSRVIVKGEIIEQLITPISAVLLFAFSLFIDFLITKDNKGIFIKTCKLFRNFCYIIIAVLIGSCFFDDWLVYEIRDNPFLFIAFIVLTIVLSLLSLQRLFTKIKNNEPHSSSQ